MQTNETAGLHHPHCHHPQMPALNTILAPLHRVLAWRPGGYLRASGALFAWLAVRTLAQTALFVLVARTLGADGYGSLIAIMAVATLFAPMAGLGGQSLLVRDGARNPQNIPHYLGDALRLWFISALPLCLLIYSVCCLLEPKTLSGYAIAAIVLADLAGASLLELLARTWQAAQRMTGFGAVMAGLVVLRLGAFCLLLVVTVPTPEGWAFLYSGTTIFYLVFIAYFVFYKFDFPGRSGKSLVDLSFSGLPFGFASSVMRIQAEANKPILAHFDSLSGVGSFSAGQRVVDLVMIPISAMIEALTPRAFGSALGVRGIFSFGVPVLIVAAIGGCLIAVGSTYVPYVLGSSFFDAVQVVKFLSFFSFFCRVEVVACYRLDWLQFAEVFLRSVCSWSNCWPGFHYVSGEDKWASWGCLVDLFF
jgi:O-antigen/teichoic acid export membrane protein